jgi:hypothetical protein
MGWIDSRDVHSGKLLCKYDPDRHALHRDVSTAVGCHLEMQAVGEAQRVRSA